MLYAVLVPFRSVEAWRVIGSSRIITRSGKVCFGSCSDGEYRADINHESHGSETHTTSVKQQ